MITCEICGKEVKITCICGFCDDCIRIHTHEGCNEIMKKKKEERK